MNKLKVEKDYQRNGRKSNGKYGRKRDESSNRRKKKKKIFLNCAFKNIPNGFNLIQILADSMCRKCCRWLSSAAGMAWKGNSSCGCLNRLFTAKIPTVPSYCHETVTISPLFETSIWAFQMTDLCVVETRRVLGSSSPVVEEQPRRFPIS